MLYTRNCHNSPETRVSSSREFQAESVNSLAQGSLSFVMSKERKLNIKSQEILYKPACGNNKQLRITCVYNSIIIHEHLYQHILFRASCTSSLYLLHMFITAISSAEAPSRRRLQFITAPGICIPPYFHTHPSVVFLDSNSGARGFPSL